MGNMENSDMIFMVDDDCYEEYLKVKQIFDNIPDEVYEHQERSFKAHLRSLNILPEIKTEDVLAAVEEKDYEAVSNYLKDGANPNLIINRVSELHAGKSIQELDPEFKKMIEKSLDVIERDKAEKNVLSSVAKNPTNAAAVTPAKNIEAARAR